MLFYIILSLLALYYVPKFIIWAIKMNRICKFSAKFPGPRAYPIVGNALSFGKDCFDTGIFIVEEANRQLAKGNTVMRLWMGPRPVFFPLNGEAMKPILDSTVEITKGSDYDFFIPWLGVGLLISTGSKWKSRRRMLTPTFHFAMLDGYVEKMDKHSSGRPLRDQRHIQILVDILEEHVDKEIEMYQFVKRCALDIICDTAMGKDLDSQHIPNQPYVLSVAEFNNVARDHIFIPSASFPPIWFLFYRRRYNEALSKLTAFTKQVIAERMEAIGSRKMSITGEHGNRKAFLDMLIEMKDQNDLSFEDIREEVDTFMFEGHDTTSSAMAWTLWCLATNPDVQEKAYEEVHSVLGDVHRECTVEDLKKMTYLERVVKEVLRIFPAVPMVQRRVKNDFEMAGYVVPAGTDIMIMPLIVHHNRKVYPNDWVFDPDNFLPDRIAARHAYDFIPFSAGLRNCIGQKFALYEEKLVVAKILQRFSLHTDRKMVDNRYGPEVMLRPSLGVPVTLKRRH